MRRRSERETAEEAGEETDAPLEAEPPEGAQAQAAVAEEPDEAEPETVAAAQVAAAPGVQVRERTDALRIALIGGTGPEGLGLAMRFAKAGHMVFIGSRSEERAEQAIAKVKEKIPAGDVFGGLNLEGAEKADIVFLTVPYDAHADTLRQLAEAIGDKILVDLVAPMVFDKDGPRAIDVEEGSAAIQARKIAQKAKVVSGLHHLDGSLLQKIDRPMQGDVLICSDHRGAKRKIMDLVEEIEYVRALDAGGLANSRYLEQWTAVLLHVNRIYKAHTGIRVTGI